MTPKQTPSQKLKKYRQTKADQYANAIISLPEKIRLYSALRHPGVIIIMGDIRSGKTGLAHEIANEMHKHRRLPAAIHVPQLMEQERRQLKRLVPSWMSIVGRRSEWPQHSVIIYDEAAQSAHARRSQSGQAVELDELLAISGQREQLIVFISHYSRKLDLNVCASVHRIIWKRPTFAHQLWERDEMADFTMKAYDFFNIIRGEVAKRRASLILDMDSFGFYQCTNRLPSWWSDKLSRIFKENHLRRGVI